MTVSEQLQQLQKQASGGNLKGTLAGGVAGALVAFAATKGWLDLLIALAAKYGLSQAIAAIVIACGGTVTAVTPEVVVPAALALAAGMAVNYAVTHWSFGATLQAAYEALPQTYAEYPNDPKPPASQGPSNSNINKNGDGNNG